MTTHTVGQQHASVSQQGSSAETKPVVKRIVKREAIIFDLRKGDDEQEFQEVEEIDISDDEPMVRRLGEEREDVASIIDSGAGVA